MQKKVLLKTAMLSTLVLLGAPEVYSDSVTHSITNTDLNKSALVKSKDNFSVFDGSKLKMENEQDTVLFQDDFSSGDLSNWSSSAGATVKNEDGRSFVSLPVDSHLDLNSIEGTQESGFYKISYDYRYKNVIADTDWLTLEWTNSGTSQLSIQSGVFFNEQWTHTDFFIAIDNNTDIPANIRIKAPATSEASSDAVVADFTNFKVSRVEPTLNEDFSDGKIDEKIQTNPNFNYEIDNDEQLKVTMPKAKLSLGEFGEWETYTPVLTSEEALNPAVIKPDEVTYEDTFFFTSLKSSSDVENDKKLSTNIYQKADDNQYAAQTVNNGGFLSPDNFTNISPNTFGLSNTEFINPLTIRYGLSENKLTNDIAENSILYIKNFKSYKGITTIKNVDSTQKQSILVK